MTPHTDRQPGLGAALLRWLTWPPLAVVAGACQALALADPWTGQAHGWLQLLALAYLVLMLRQHAGPAPAFASSWQRRLRMRPWRRAFVVGWLFALGWLAGTVWWLFVSLHTYGGLAAPLAVAAVLALAGGLGLYYALACALFAALGGTQPERSAWRVALLFAACWTLAELARGQWLSGFPWGAVGYAHVDGWLDFLPRYVGVYGLGFVAAAIAALLAQAHHPDWRRWTQGLPLLALIGLGVLLTLQRHCALDACGRARPPEPPFMAVELLQGNIAQNEKFVAGSGVADALRWYGQSLREARAPLVVAPETAVPVLPADMPSGYWDGLRQRFARGPQAALLGVPLGDARTGYTNSVRGLAPGQAQPYRYDKHHLVPFGEFIPRFFKWFTELLNIPLGDFERGALVQPPFVWQGQRLALNICYEDLFGEELAARFADPAQAPTAFVNVSNIGWFGDSTAIDQHLAISRMRVLEFERPMLRATNTGATAIIDHRAQVVAQLPRLTRGVLRGQFQGRHEPTPYAQWAAHWGLAPLWALSLALVLVLGRWRRRTD